MSVLDTPFVIRGDVVFNLDDSYIKTKGPYKIIVPNYKDIIISGKFTYDNYLALDSNAKVIPTSEKSDKPKVNYLVVMRNVYKNQVVVYPRCAFFMTLENDTWNDEAPFDDYSVISGQRCCCRSFGSYPAKYTKEVVYPSLNLRVEGAMRLHDEFYVLVQVIFGDNVEPPSSWKLKNITSIKPKNELEEKVLECLAIVEKKEG